MVGLAILSIQTEPLLESNMLGTLIGSYFFSWLLLFVSFLNIYSVDKFEFLNRSQKCVKFKHKMFFLIMYSKEKNIVSKKTLILESIGYLIFILSITIFAFSLKATVKTAFILLGIIFLSIYIFGWITGSMYQKTK